MLRIQRHVVRYGLLLLGTAVAAACAHQLMFDSTGGLVISLSQTSTTAEQGNSAQVTVTLLTATALECGSAGFGISSGGDASLHHSFSNPLRVSDGTTDTWTSVLTLSLDDVGPAPRGYALVVKGACGFTYSVETNLSLSVTPHPSFLLSLSAAALTIAQGASTPTTTVTIGRTNFTGPVTLSVPNPPTGVTAAFAPANPQTGNSAVLTLSVAPGTTIGALPPLTVQGVGSTGTVSTPLNLTVATGTPAGNFTLSTNPSGQVSLIQGSGTSATVSVLPTGGNTSSVTLTATAAFPMPAGMSLTFAPPSTATTSTLTIATTTLTPVGAYPFVIRGNVTGLAEQQVNLSINVTAPAAGPNVTLSFGSCPGSGKPAWVAAMDGVSGTWTAVAPTVGMPDLYQFNVAQARGSFAWVTTSGFPRIFVQHMTQAELTAGPLDLCGTPAPNGKTVSGTIDHLPTGALAILSFARDATTAAVNGAFSFSHALDGSFDLVGWAGSRVFVARGENPAGGGSFSVPVDFTHATRSAPPASAAATVNVVTGTETLSQSMDYFTGGSACVPATLYSEAVGTPGGFLIHGVPVSLRATGDAHRATFIASGTDLARSLTETFVDVGARAGSPFVLPPPLPVPVATDAGGPYRRPSVVVAGVPAEFDVSHTLTYQAQSTSSPKAGTITASQGWVGGSSLALSLPNFAGVGAFNNAWAPGAAVGVSWQVQSTGGSFPTVCGVGQRTVSSTRLGVL